MDLAKTAREITRFMLPYLTTRQSRQLEKVISHCPFDESQLAEDGCEFESESFLDLFMSAKRLEGCSDRTICYYEATIKKSLNLSMRQFATWEPKKLDPIFPLSAKSRRHSRHRQQRPKNHLKLLLMARRRRPYHRKSGQTH